MAEVRGTHLNITETSASQTGAGNGETLRTVSDSGKGIGVVYYDPAGSRTGVILQAGDEDGQQVRVVNTADAAETITFATAATSHVALGASAVISQNQSMSFAWSATLGMWVSAGGTATIGNGAVGTTQLADASVTSAKIDASIIQTVTVTLTATEIVGTATGDIAATAGAPLVAAVADTVHEFISAVLIYDYDTAAYTGGGDDVVIRNGTTAVTGAVTKANLLGASGDKIAVLEPLAVAGVPLTANSTLNIFATTAYTQPGTAAGVLRVKLTYRSVAAGLA